mmetsp:Transcript_11046/g.30518  ORF Transcript_11046/g.30518 Transcript_11046/m.30518 type:complete len:210 (+) Transcript_11046:134-763(+)
MASNRARVLKPRYVSSCSIESQRVAVLLHRKDATIDHVRRVGKDREIAAVFARDGKDPQAQTLVPAARNAADVQNETGDLLDRAVARDRHGVYAHTADAADAQQIRDTQLAVGCLRCQFCQPPIFAHRKHESAVPGSPNVGERLKGFCQLCRHAQRPRSTELGQFIQLFHGSSDGTVFGVQGWVEGSIHAQINPPLEVGAAAAVVFVPQ